MSRFVLLHLQDLFFVLLNLCLLAILIPLTQGFPYKHSHEEEDDEEEEEEDDKWGKFGKYGKYGKSYEDEEEEKDDYGSKKMFFPFHKKEDEYTKKPKWSSGGWSPISPPGLDLYGQGKYNPKYYKSYGSEEEEYPKKKKSYKKKSKKEEISKDILKEVDKYIPEIDFVDEEKKKA
ncbi:uncharacterized protein LOC107361041 isoform X1 [Tetranychus urticae]|uniref:uncharacterized protein LOC107361041 isoform X1 n=1 Tax=Tetranychus urticae TaxID=32264 RepID=UPI000D64B7C4|nr:uncharacterized protein LOC107361041 isoform X1 [Tetranychus urticae]